MSKQRVIIKPDIAQCQAEKPNGHTFMTLGGSPGMERCTNFPSIIIVEVEPGSDNKCGSMSLCTDCFRVFKEQNPDAKVVVWEKLVEKKQAQPKVTAKIKVSFKGQKATLESIFGNKPIDPNTIVGILWEYLRKNNLLKTRTTGK